MIKKIIVRSVNILAAGIMVFASACHSAPATSEDEQSTDVITPVTVVSMSYKPITETIDLPAISAFIVKSTARSTTSGTIESSSVKPGDIVKKGQEIFTIRTRESSAISNALKGDTSLSFNGMIHIFSSRNGVISTVTHQNGDFVQEGDELASISEQESLVFILDSPFEYVKYIEQTRRCKIALSDGRTLDGVTGEKLPEMDPQAQTVRYMIKPLSGGNLPANLNALVSILKSSRTKAQILPKPAVLGNEIQTEFWIMKMLNDSIAIKVPVIKGYENNDEIEISSPEFKETDRFILTGGYGIPDTAKVIIK